MIDVNLCTADCNACVSACAEENGLTDHGRPATDAQWIRKVGVRDPKSGVEKSVPVMCQHCAEPPCVDVCPTGASFKRADGIVLVDKHICIGCRYCMMACPYKARSFIHENLATRNPMPRAARARWKAAPSASTGWMRAAPACVEACGASGNGAMTFGDLNDPDSEISKRVAAYATRQIRADLGVDPGVRYQNL